MPSKTYNPQKRTSNPRSRAADHSPRAETPHPLAALQRKVGNRAVQRLIQRNGGIDGPFELDDETAGRINHQRGGGQPLDSLIQARMGEQTGADLSGVRVHTSPEAVELNRQLSAKAFTTGRDIFFSAGAYQPGSTVGQELLAHELTHVVQQSSGAAGGAGGPMTVNAPDDAYEQEADAVAKAALSPASSGGVQRKADEDEEVESA